ncbi:MAG: DUF2059 domain-containing protein [Rhizobacter sp.]|nr:DUF2059 domain-containing protein [Rhizobacter sp.]
MNRRLLAHLLLALACSATPLARAGTTAPATPSPEKQKLVDTVLSLWHLEDTAVVMVQRPAAEAMQQARIALQGRVSAAKQEATLHEITPDLQKYIDEATPIVKTAALRIKAPTIGPLLAQNFSDDELRQLIALLESPVKKKFEQLLPQFERAFGEKVAAECRTSIDPKLHTMTEAVGLKLRAASIAP